MRNLRLVTRLTALVLSSGVFYIVWVLGQIPARLGGRLEDWRRTMFGMWGRIIGAILHMRVTVDGRPPEPPFLLVSNHLSYVDIVLLAGTAPCVFVSKAEVGSWPGIGLLARSIGTLFVDRRRKRDVQRVAGEITERLAAGGAIVLFPEGTSTPGEAVADFRSSLLEPAAREGLSVRYAAIHYHTPPGEAPAHLAVSWWGDMTLGPHLFDLLRLPWFGARIVFGKDAIRAGDRKTLASGLHRAVSSCFTPTKEPEESCLPIGT